MRRIKPILIVTLAIFCIFSCFALGACTTDDSSNGNGPNTPPSGVVTITFATGTGDTVSPITAKAGSKIYPPVDPTRDGYRFDGWTLKGEPFVFDKMPDSSITLQAAWSKLYALSFDTGAPTLYYAEGDTIVLPDEPQKTGYKFIGWKQGSGAFTATAMPANDVALVADWVEAVTITFNTGVSGFTVKPIVETAGTAISAPTANYPGYYVSGWKLHGDPYKFTTMPDADITLTAELTKLTNLPSMFIDLKDGDETVDLHDVDRINYVDSSITLTNTKDEYILNNVAAGFRGRGNGSWNEQWPNGKLGYKIKFDKKQSLFGQAANKHWVILACANFDDVTMSRNYLAFNMGREVFSAIEHTTIAEWVDVYINGNYHGLYLLCEHTRVGDGRVDISSEYTTEPEHNGFLVEYDAYGDQPNPDKGEYNFENGINYFKISGVKYPFTVHSPDPEDYAEEITKAEYQRQVAYIKDYVTQVYNAALNGDFDTFADLVDVNSFVDMYILHELFKNVDCGYSSFYLYKKPNGKLYAGPPWDFDATTNINDRGDRTPQGLYVAEQVISGSNNCASELYIELYKNNSFKKAVVARWKTLSPKISAFIEERMNDEVYAENKAAMGKNFAKWKNKSQAAAEADWVNDMKTLKKWFTDRIAWLNTTWK